MVGQMAQPDYWGKEAQRERPEQKAALESGLVALTVQQGQLESEQLALGRLESEPLESRQARSVQQDLRELLPVVPATRLEAGLCLLPQKGGSRR